MPAWIIKIQGISHTFNRGAPRLLLRPDLHHAKAFNHLAETEVFQLEQLAHLDLAFLAIDGGSGISPSRQ